MMFWFWISIKNFTNALDIKHSFWTLVPVFLQLDLFKLYIILLYQPCKNLVLLAIFIPHNFITVNVNKPLIVVFTKDAKNPIIFNWLSWPLLALHSNDAITLNIYIIICLHFFDFWFSLIPMFRFEPSWSKRGILTL